VYVSFGSFLSVRGDVLAVVVDALRGLDVRVALAHGSSPRGALGPLPEGWLVREVLPQVTLLRHAALGITHGGNNSVTEALTAGVPLLVLPFSTDQFAGAAALEKAGFAEVLDPNVAGMVDVRDAAVRLLALAGEPRERLARLAQDLSAHPGAERARAALTAPGAALVARLDAALRARAVPERAAGEKAYLKSDLEHYGTSLPAMRAAVRESLAGVTLDHDALVALVEELWAAPVHERRAAAVELLEQNAALLGVADADLLERLLRESRTWALVDGLAASVVGPLTERDPAWEPRLDAWATDPDFWLRRSALLAHLLPLRTGGGDWGRFTRFADAMLPEKEFFIRKAIGWVLRDTARRRPDLVFEWLLPRAGRASGVTLREAVKPLTPAQRDAVLAAR